MKTLHGILLFCLFLSTLYVEASSYYPHIPTRGERVVAVDLQLHRANTQTISQHTDLPGIKQLSAGMNHTCALFWDGSVKCWGTYHRRHGRTYINAMPNPHRIANVQNAIAITSGNDHTCALGANGSVWCWGTNEEGQLGNGNYGDSLTATQMRGLRATARAIAAGCYFTCVLLTNGQVQCVGENRHRQIGVPSINFSSTSTPVLANGISAAEKLYAGGSNAAVRLSDDNLFVWGADWQPQSLISLIPLLRDMSSLFIANVDFSCGIDEDEVKCVGGGDRRFGPLRDLGQEDIVAIPGLGGAIQIAGFTSNICGVMHNRQVKCYGDNVGGQLGIGTTSPFGEPYNLPQEMIGVDNAKEVVVGNMHACVLMNDQTTVKCVGLNSNGKLGVGSAAERITIPQEVVGLFAD